MEPTAPQSGTARGAVIVDAVTVGLGLVYLVWGLLDGSWDRSAVGAVILIAGAVSGWMYRRRMRRS